MRKFTTTLLILLILRTIGFGQDIVHKWAFGVDGGVIEYYGDHRNSFYKFSSGSAAGATISRYLSPSFDLGLNFFYDRVDMLENVAHRKFPQYQWTIDPLILIKPELKYKLNNGYIFKEDAKIRPFLKGGIGAVYAVTNGDGINGTETNLKFIKPNVSFGPGINIPIWKVVSLEFYSVLNYPIKGDYMDLLDESNPAVFTDNGYGDLYLQNVVSLKINIGGKAKDSDNDGIPDKKDLCPDTPDGVAVDENGCPLDGDGDGVPDYLDECPTVPGLKEFNGCPDTDGDGIPDKDDDCPDVAGLKIFNGCPDSDGDGVPDKDDRCPDTPKGWVVDKFGCPVDRDRDGIPDSEDDCPDEPGVAELKGCPWTSPTLMAKYGLDSKLILFDFDKSELRQSAINTLGQINTVLQNHSDFGVSLVGHTDWTGTEAYNMGLSDRRANSAKSYLMNKGIEAIRIKTAHFGEDKPTATNKTSEGRQLNRRVDYEFFKIK